MSPSQSNLRMRGTNSSTAAEISASAAANPPMARAQRHGLGQDSGSKGTEAGEAKLHQEEAHNPPHITVLDILLQQSIAKGHPNRLGNAHQAG